MNRSNKLLLLEDEPLIAMDLEATLQERGFDVVHLRSCAAAEAWLDANLPAIAVVDVMLADGMSHDVVTRLQDARVPFVVHSGDHANLYQDTPFAHGIWLSKPTTAQDLIDAVEAAAAVVSEAFPMPRPAAT